MSDKRDLRDIVAATLEVDPADLTETSDFVNDHGADSMLVIDLLNAIEIDLGVAIPDDHVPEMTNLTAVADLVSRYAH
ncbi:acyl carrier protein [Spirillospora sp. NPDC049652]